MDWKEDPKFSCSEALPSTHGGYQDEERTTGTLHEDTNKPVYLDLDNPSVQVDVEGLGSDDEIDVSEVHSQDSSAIVTRASHSSTDDSGIVLDLSKSGEFSNTPSVNRNKPLGTSTPLWRPWHEADSNTSQDDLNSGQAYRNSMDYYQHQAHESKDWIKQQAGFQRPLDVIIPYGYPYHVFDPRFLRSPASLSAGFSPMAHHQFAMMPAHSPQSAMMTQHAAMMAHQTTMMTPPTARIHLKSAMMISPSPTLKSNTSSQPLPTKSQTVQMVSPASLANAQQNIMSQKNFMAQQNVPSQSQLMPSHQNAMSQPHAMSSHLLAQCQVPQITTTQPTKLPTVQSCKRPLTSSDENKATKRRRVGVTPRRLMTAEVKKEPLVECSSNLHRVVLSSPPAGALPARLAAKGKRKAAKAEVKNARKDAEKTKRRDKPPLYGDHELHELDVVFEDIPLRYKFCDESGKFVVPVVPDERDAQVELRQELLELFKHSNLPPVPNSLRYSVHALCHYPHMHHLFSLYQDGVDLETLQFGAYGQAFGNIKLAEMGEEALNKILDQMSYVGADGLMHCLVRRAIDNGVVCDHVATELGKMRRHSKNHYPEKKWVCCFCRAQMPDMTDMERHTSTHTGLKPFRCVECNKFFSQKVTLEHHMISVHNLELEKMDPKKTFTCRQDGCLFLEHEREACLLHLAQHHDEDDFKNRRKRKQWPYDS